MNYRTRMAMYLAVASLAAAGPATADNATPAREEVKSDPVSVNRDLARAANKAAAEKAAQSLLNDTKLDLDIRLIGPTSVKIAGDR